MALVHWTFAQVILEQKKHQRRLIGSTWWMEVGCFQVLFIISPTFTLTDGWSSKKLNLEIHFPVQRTEKRKERCWQSDFIFKFFSPFSGGDLQ